MKFKNLKKEQIIISLDRLTRFKNTKEKYLRVFSDILISCLIEPKLKKTDIEKMDYNLMAGYVSEIFNTSINNFLPINTIDNAARQNNVNSYIKDYENSIFNNDDDTQKLLNNNINYDAAIKLIDTECPIFLKWLKQMVFIASSFHNTVDQYQYEQFIDISKQSRKDLLLKYPIEKVLLVEGITEEILLPAFSKFIGYDFYANGIQIIAAGGKNQVVKKYYELTNQLKLPVFVLLDKDAEDNIQQIKPKLRQQDTIHLVSCGEFEDLLPKSLIIKTVNSHFKNFLAITETDLNKDVATAKILEEIFKTKGLHEFKKAEFAKLVRENISENIDITPEINDIINEIIYTNKMLDRKICS